MKNFTVWWKDEYGQGAKEFDEWEDANKFKNLLVEEDVWAYDIWIENNFYDYGEEEEEE